MPSPDDDLPHAFAAEPPPADPTGVDSPSGRSGARSRSLLEHLLDPRSIQWLMLIGGASMVIGLVILLAVNDYFTPRVLAGTLGAANIALLLSGWAVVTRTRFHTAGRALTLLACLIMPLNLWYYSSHNLLTMEHQGHLWVAALVISGLYFASAQVLRDELFVYVFTGGITLTALLMLADLPPSPDRFWEITLPSTTLVVLGLLAIHAERAFPEQEGPFGRRRFGRAYFRSGQLVLAGGLLLLLGAQLAGNWLYDPFFRPVYASFQKARPDIVTTAWGRSLGLALVVAGLYASVYSHLLVRRDGLFVPLAAFQLAWAGFLLLDVLQIQLTVELVIVALSLTAVAVNLLEPQVRGATAEAERSWLVRLLPLFGLMLCLIPVLIGEALLAERLRELRRVDHIVPTPFTVMALVVSALASRFNAHLYAGRPHLMKAYFFAAAGATMNALIVLLLALGLQQWGYIAQVVMLLPLAYLAAAGLWRHRQASGPLLAVAHVVTAVLIVLSGDVLLHGFTAPTRPDDQLTLALFCLEIAAFYLTVAGVFGQPGWLVVGTLGLCGSLWQLLNYWHLGSDFYTVAFAVSGLLLVLLGRLGESRGDPDPTSAAGAVGPTRYAGHGVLSIALVAALFIGLSRLTDADLRPEFLGVCAGLAGTSLAAVAAARANDWKRWYSVHAVGQALLFIVGLTIMARLSPWQKVELVAVGLGVLFLVIGHIGWLREQEEESGLVTFSLLMGSLLAGMPLALATVVDRVTGLWSNLAMFHEIAFLLTAIFLLLSGVVCRLKATTLTGALLTVVYFVSLLVFVPWDRLSAVAIVLLVVGGGVFGLGLMLSLFRDRLLALPDQVRKRAGVFQVFGWR